MTSDIDVILHFNSQPHEEADCFPHTYSVLHMDFNSQPHEEADQGSITCKIAHWHFNSQPHEEADSNFKQKSFYLKLFFIFIA